MADIARYEEKKRIAGERLAKLMEDAKRIAGKIEREKGLIAECDKQIAALESAEESEE